MVTLLMFACADLDDDGALDVVSVSAVTNDSSVTVFLNTP